MFIFKFCTYSALWWTPAFRQAPAGWRKPSGGWTGTFSTSDSSLSPARQREPDCQVL